jgi:hypothetical protein
MRARRSEIAQMELELAHDEMRSNQEMRVSEAFGEAQSVLGNRQPGAQFSAVTYE